MPASLDELPALLTPAELAELMRTTQNSLAQDRYLGQGVPFVKHGRKVLYDRDEVRSYLARNRCQRTDDPRGVTTSSDPPPIAATPGFGVLTSPSRTQGWSFWPGGEIWIRRKYQCRGEKPDAAAYRRRPAWSASLMSPPGLMATRATGGYMSAAAKSQTEQWIRHAHVILANCGVVMSPSKVSRLVRQFEARVARNGWTLFEFLANAAQLSAEQRRHALRNPYIARVIAYADPTGETAVNNVMRAPAPIR